MCASVGPGSRVAKVTMPTVEITLLTEEVPVKVQPSEPEVNIVATETPPVPPLAPPPVPPDPVDPALEPQPSPIANIAPKQLRVVDFLFIVVGAAAYGRVSPSSTSPSFETRSTSARSGVTWTRAYRESGQWCAYPVWDESNFQGAPALPGRR